jgi:hypothetical protein
MQHGRVGISRHDQSTSLVMRKVQSRAGSDLDYAAARFSDDVMTIRAESTALPRRHEHVIDAWKRAHGRLCDGHDPTLPSLSHSRYRE